MLSISPGHSVEYLTREVATGRENYYTGAVAEGEPPGRWYGTGAEALGLTGLVDHQDMEALFEHFLDPRDPYFRSREAWREVATLGHQGRRYLTAEEIYQRSLDAEPHADPERREQLRLDASKKERRNVAFMDVTFSVPKSVTVLHAAFEAQEVKARAREDLQAAAAWGAHKQAVEDAIWAGNNAGLDYLAENAGYSRIGHHGGVAGRFTDAHDWTVASFFQHTSRTNDPQLHIHNATFSRVQCADGDWRTLDGRSLYLHRPAAAAVAERTMFEHAGASMRTLAAMRPDGRSREILGVPEQANDLFSARRRAIGPKTAELVAAFETRYRRGPNALELDRLQRHATMATRPRKSHDGETLEQRLDRMERTLRAELDISLEQIADEVLARAESERPIAEPFDAEAVIETALADVQATKAAWTEADLLRAVNDALPDYLGGLDSADVQRLLRGLTQDAIAGLAVPLTAAVPGAENLPAELRLADGRSAYERPGSRVYATDAHLRSERALRAAAADRCAAAISQAAAARFVSGLAESGIELGVDQAAAARGVLTSRARVETLVGPAGTGKSFVIGVIARAWQAPGSWPDGTARKVVGLAASQIAADVLAGERLDAANITRWLAAQDRLNDGRTHPDDAGWQLNAGDLVIVDESAMADTAHLARIHDLVAAADAKLLLVGDHRQLAAVGAGGGMHLAAAGRCYELTEARRFTHSWERAASLQLREGDETALVIYRKHGRIIDGGSLDRAERQATRAWLADTLAGQRSLLIVDTNEQADRVCAQLRAELVRLGRVEEAGVRLSLQATIAGVGDLVQARRNGWELAGYRGNRRGPINREHYRVLETSPNGGLVVAPVLGRSGEREELGDRMSLPGGYVAEHVALAYATTVHAAQGLTVDTSHTVASHRTSSAALYVGMSRGRASNTAYVITIAVPDDSPPGTANQTIHRDPIAVLSRGDDDEGLAADLPAIARAEQNTVEVRSLRTIAERFTDACQLATAGRTSAMLDRLVDTGALTSAQRATLAADEGLCSLDRVLRQAEIAGHDPYQLLDGAVRERDLTGARSLASVLHHRITETVDLHPAGEHYADWIPTVADPTWERHLAELAHAADARREQLGHQGIDAEWARRAFGPVPEDDAGRAEWARRVGAVAAHRELTDHHDADVALPGPPKPGQAEAYASWHTAWRALGRDEATRAEAEMSDGQLRVRVRAYEREKAWEPDYVAPELSGTRQAAERHRTTATLRAAEAAAEADVKHRAELAREAAQAEALADVLDRRAGELEHADEARALWYAHTAETRAAAHRARDELGARGIDPDHYQRWTNAEQWLDAHRRDQAEEDQHRPITDETDLAHVIQQRDADTRTARPEPTAAVEVHAVDVREHGAAQPTRAERDEHDWTRVPTAAETADTLARAQRALIELEQRRTAERRHDLEEHRARQLERWHDNRHTEPARDNSLALER